MMRFVSVSGVNWCWLCVSRKLGFGAESREMEEIFIMMIYDVSL